MQSNSIQDALVSPKLEGRWLNALYVLFFFSGFPALIYQLTWQRALFRIFGVNIESVTVVVTAFMLGLGLGSLAGGWLCTRLRIPLLYTLALVEVMTAIYGLLSLDVFEYVGGWLVGLPLAVTAVATIAVVFVPTFLMGATLPILVNHLVPRLRNVGMTVGTLYYVNTLGAGASCLFSMLALFPWIGMRGSVLVAVGINLLVALAAVLTHIATRRAMLSTTPVAANENIDGDAGGDEQEHWPWRHALWLSALCGFVALSFEIYFFRVVSFASGSSALAFAACLGAYLVGLASGAQSAAEACKSHQAHALRRWTVRRMLGGIAVAVLLVPALALTASADAALLGLALLIVYLHARFWGVAFPNIAHLSISPDAEAGMRTSQLYLANILGAAAGSVFTGFVLMQHTGLLALGLLLGIMGVAVAYALAAGDGVRRGVEARTLVGPSALVLVALLGVVFTHRPLEALQFKSRQEPAFAQTVENRSGIITATVDGTVFGNGVYDGKFNVSLRDDTNGIVRPFALSLFHPRPARILMIGVASGSWAQVLANHPQIESLTVVEINSGYQQLIASRPEVASVLTHPKVRFITDDGRRWLRANRHESFDAIVANATFHFRSNATNLLSQEFLELAKSSLRSGGVLFYNSTDSSRVQRTACSVFGQGARFTNHMVVSTQPVDWNFSRWRTILEQYKIDGNPVLMASRVSDRDKLDALMSLESHLLESKADGTDAIEPCGELLKRTEGETLITDDNMGTEWRHPIGLK